MLRMFRTAGVLAAAPLWLLFLYCAAPAQEKSPGFAVEHVAILPMTVNGIPITDATLLVVDGRIAKIGPADTVHVPKEMSRIDGRGHWLMPGLADMHVHTLNRAYGRFEPRGTDFPPDYVQTADIMLPFIANGVTQILEMSALPETLRQRHEIESGAVLGPHVAAAAMLDGDPPVWQLNARVATTPEQGRRAVRDIAAAGYAFVKIYARLEMPVFQAVIEEGRVVGLPVIGHVPAGSRGRAEDVLVPGFAMVAHAEEFAKLNRESSDHIRHYAQLARRSGTWITSTLTTNDWIARQTRDPRCSATIWVRAARQSG